MIFEISGGETGTAMGIADGAVNEELGVQQVCRWRSGIIGVAQAISSCNTADSPGVFFKGGG